MSWPLPWNEHTVLALAAESDCPFMWLGGSSLFVAQSGASEVVRAAGVQGHTVVGLDGYLISDGIIAPQLDMIYDSDRVADDVDPADVVSEWTPGAWVEITLLEPR